jgi:hypothetical protein
MEGTTSYLDVDDVLEIFEALIGSPRDFPALVISSNQR